MKNKTKRAAAKTQRQNPVWRILPVALAMLLVPTLVYVNVITLDPDAARLVGETICVDIFSQMKARALYLLTFFAGCVVADGLMRKSLSSKPGTLTQPREYGHEKGYWIAAAVFLAFTLLSALLSSHKAVAFWGFYDRAEGFVTQLCYMLMFAYAATRFPVGDGEEGGKDSLHWIAIALSVVTILNLGIGMFQFTGRDPYLTDVGKLLVGASNMNGESRFAAGSMCGTMYHYNYLGGYTALVFPFFLIMIFASRNRKSLCAVYAVCSAMTLAMAWGCSARSAFLGIGVSVAVGVVLLIPAFFNWARVHKTAAIIVIGVLVAAVAALGVIAGPGILRRLPSALQDFKSIFQPAEEAPAKEGELVQIWNEDDGTVRFKFATDDLILYADDGNLLMKDGAGNPVEPVLSPSADYTQIDISDARYHAFHFRAYEQAPGQFYAYSLSNEQFMFIIKVDEDQGVYIREPFIDEKMTLQYPETVDFFTGRESIGSGRGYIWSRAIPLLKRHILIGSGPDTFPYEFPQRELAAKYRYMNDASIFVDKMHNQYMHLILENGGIAFLAIMALCVGYLIDSLRLYAWRKRYGVLQLAGLAILLSVVGYLTTWFVNDSVVYLSSVFWILLGVGVGVNRAVKKAGD